jgi:FdrA protein
VAAVVSAGAGVVVSLCGTAGDPQGREGQARAFVEAGASVMLGNAAAARLAARLTGGKP